MTVSERAQRILEGVTHALDSFESLNNDVMRLALLTQHLSYLISELHGEVDEEWREELLYTWSTLEIVNAFALADERTVLTDDECTRVFAARDELRAMLTAYDAGGTDGDTEVW